MAVYLGNGEELVLNYVIMAAEPIAYLYNGVRLPALPEWDRERYPYLVMWYAEDLSYGALYAFSTPHHLTTFGIGVGVSEGEVYLESKWGGFLINTKPFTPFVEKTATSSANFTTAPNWANYDVLTNDGTLYLAGSNPIPIYNEPTEYLYNGIRLPKLPEWDKTVYPYAYMTRYYDDTTALYSVIFHASATPATYVGIAFGTQVSINAPRLFVSYDSKNKKWNDVLQNNESSYDISPLYTVFWANTGITKSDGSVYLAASEPVPVYEYFAYEADISNLCYM